MVSLIRPAVLRSTVEFDALESEWAELLSAVPDHSLSQTFHYNRVAWTRLAEPRGSRLAVVTVRRGGELLLVWPLHIERRRGHTVATHLGNRSTQEYAVPVVRPGEHAEEALALAIAEATRLADVLAVYHQPDGPLPAGGRFSALAFGSSTTSPVAVRPDEGFEAWSGTRPQKLRWEMRRNRKRLQKAGTVAFRTSDDEPAFGHQAVDWIFARKREWLVRRHKTTPWISDGSGEEFFHELLDRTPAGAQVRPLVVGVTVDDELVSASICYCSAHALEGFVMAFDESQAALGAGNVLIEECVRLAFDRGLDFDFRIDAFAYKLRWSDRETTRHTRFVPCTVRGLAPVGARHATHAYAELKRVSTPLLTRYLPGVLTARASHQPPARVAVALVQDVRTLVPRRAS
ncbi:GNAT family N-acetyltransferase [Pseudonocardia sp. RS11V-5]|uniref:GNAT family N-acetyltransferase n=1 Tax=Pseudonocardia terrae TaxID=2905831 RepID=UPI001E4E2336|nr:GNAT family N-acetyltransferase [Pseudonocardia terrae]MCE3555754.1 GNAT family N-acetyltransferase [Pseudonocardia terrae]